MSLSARRRFRTAWLAGVVGAAAITVAAAFGLGFGASADGSHGKPARLLHGGCDTLGAVAFELTGVGATIGPDDEAIPEPPVAGAPGGVEVLLSETVVAASLAEIAGGEHALAVFESDEAPDEVVACGQVGGPMLGDELVVGLREAGGSGLAGFAVLAPAPDGRGTRVTIYLGEGMVEAAAPTADVFPAAERTPHVHADGEVHYHPATPAP